MTCLLRPSQVQMVMYVKIAAQHRNTMHDGWCQCNMNNIAVYNADKLAF